MEKNNIETTATEAVVKEPTRNELMRDLSKDYGINLFDKKGIEEFKTFQDSQKSELEKVQSNLKAYENKEQEWATKAFEYESKVAALELGIKPDYLIDAMILAKASIKDDGDVKTALTSVLEKYPTFKVTPIKNDNQIQIGIQASQNQQPSGLTEQEAYMEQNYKNNRYYKSKK